MVVQGERSHSAVEKEDETQKRERERIRMSIYATLNKLILNNVQISNHSIHKTSVGHSWKKVSI